MTRSDISLDDYRALQHTVDSYLDGRRELTGLDLYYELERSTSLLTFHTMLRGGPRNRARSGLQQSYGDHNRLLMLGLDRLVEGDVEWFRLRIDPEDPVGAEALAGCIELVASLALSRETLVALWLGAALHDCGMLHGRGAYVDVEDGVVLSRPIIDALCPEHLRDLATFVLHHHDYIKGVFLGEVPAQLIVDELDALPSEQRATGLAALGLVQVAGAASLGEGRLGAFRVAIFDRCVAGTALDERGTSTRWARLLDPTPSAAVPTDLAAPAELEPFLEHAAVHGWQRVAVELDERSRVALLREIAECWAGSTAEHVVFRDGFVPFAAGTLDLGGVTSATETASTDVTVLILDR